MTSTLLPIPADFLPQYDELHVISDLHLGGRSGFQIFSSGAELVQLINHLQTSIPSNKKAALIINGDFVDFLAESPPIYFDPVNAIDKLDRIALKDTAFMAIFKALKKFANSKNRQLIINLGNHDLELALPWVRDHFLALLSGGNETARSHITLSFDGTGYLCNVGNAKVLCVHGNEVDDWNLTDYEKIRRIGRDMVQGRPVEDWIPNAGTQLVIDVMNNIKGKFPFVDLLKPEMPAVIPTLLAIAPEYYDKIKAISATAGRLIWDKFRRAVGFLGNEEHNADLFSRLVGLSLEDYPEVESVTKKSFSDKEGKNYAQALLFETEQRFIKNEQPLSIVESDQKEEYLGKMGAVWKYITGEERSEVLREALENLHKDRSFDLKYEDATFHNLDGKIGGDIDFIVAGHTHLERAIKRKKGRGWYFNSGTWIRLIKLEVDVLKDKKKFSKIFDDFAAGTMDALESSPGLVQRNLTVVTIKSNEGITSGELQHVKSEQGEIIFSPVPESRFEKN